MEFEFDSAKSMSNLVKHGISFNDTKQMWNDPRLQIVKSMNDGEPRWIAIACINNKHWSAIFTYRGPRIRIISARRSRSEEVKIYES